MKKITEFFRTSPLKGWDMVVHLLGTVVLITFFIGGGIWYAVANEPDIEGIGFVIIGVYFLSVCIWKTNPELCEKKFFILLKKLREFWKKFRDSWIQEIPDSSGPNHLIDH
jgi:hypothetical protein